MFKNASPQTKSFVILLCIAIVGSYFCLWLAGRYLPAEYRSYLNFNDYTVTNHKQQDTAGVTQAVAAEPEVIVDTSDWKEYTSKTYGFSFKYNPDWQIKQFVKQGDYYLLEIDPGRKYYNIKIYVSKNDFYVMGGLPTKETIISGLKALNVADLLYGIKKGEYYLTFDNGQSVSLKPQFNALVNSLSFE